jgi:hypothetical protein
MQSLTVDGTTATSLAHLNGLVEVRDEQGTVLGYYAPVSPEIAARYTDLLSAGSGQPNGRATANESAGQPTPVQPR